MLMRAVVVHDQVNVEVRRHGCFDRAQEAQELLVPVPRLAFGQHLAGEYVQRGEQGGGAVPFVVVSDALDVPEAHRQQRLRPLQCLHLAFLVDTQHQRLIRRIQ